MADKASIRKGVLAKRDGIPPAEKKIKDRSIEIRLFGLSEFRTAETILLFASFRSEVDTCGMISRSIEEGKRVVLPRVEGNNLGLYEIRDIVELVPGYMKIPEPSVLTEDRKITIHDMDLIIVPGAAFDGAGNRIGYGGGFYDRLLAAADRGISIVAPAYEMQVIASVPTDPHDKKVKLIVTEGRVIRCS